MKRKRLAVEFDWQRCSSEASDLKGLDPALSARILFTMYLINLFEHALLRLKNADCVWGPLHTSVGQEAIGAATMAALRKTDKITGSHRAHHQFLSKVLFYVVAESWNPALEGLPEAGLEVVKRTMAEIMGLAPGYCGGRGGSMHLRCAEAGVIGTNAIVAGGIPLATGAAFAEKRLGSSNIVVCFFGDGATNQGAFHEALNLAGLWRLPILYFIENNRYAVATKSEDAAAVKDLSLRGVSYNISSRIIEGDDVPGIYHTVSEAAQRIRSGQGPFMIEARCYRHYHHAGDLPGSAYGYRPKEEEARFLAKDPLKTFSAAVRESSLLGTADVERLHDMAKEAVRQAMDFCLASQDPFQVRSELWPGPERAAEGLRSDGRELQGLPYAESEDFREFTDIAFSDAIAAVTGRWMEKDPRVLELGEEVASFGGGAYGATKGLLKRFPDRLLNTPISEAGFVGLTGGAAMNGLKPIVEIMFPDFTLVAADQVFNQIGKARHMYGGTTDLPLIARTRIASGCGYGGQHSLDPVGLYALFQGWRIVAPSNSFDYIGLFNTAMNCLDPVVFLEHHSLYKQKFPVPVDNLDYCIPFGKAKVVIRGEQVSVLTYASMTGRLVRLREELQRMGVSFELIDLRSLDFLSIDYETLGISLRKTGAIVIIEEAADGQGIAQRLVAEITQRFFDHLDAPPACLSSLAVPPSVSRVLEAAELLSDQQILAGVEDMAGRKWRSPTTDLGRR